MLPSDRSRCQPARRRLRLYSFPRTRAALIRDECGVKYPLVYPLNPVDHMLLATHVSLQRRGYCGLNVLLVAELDGRLDHAGLTAAARRAGQWFPALSARVALRGPLRRAHWVIDPDSDPANAIDVTRAVAGGHDGSSQSDALGDRVDPAHGPQVRLVHTRLDAERHRVELRWPHHLMDLEGGLLLLEQIGAALRHEGPTLETDPRVVNAAPFNHWLPSAAWRAVRGTVRHVGHCVVNQPRLVQKPPHAAPRPDYVARHFDASQRRLFEHVARQRISPGPLRYVRAILAAVARLYKHTASARGRPRRRYLFSHALPFPDRGARRGLHGNYVTLPWVGLGARDLASWSAADEAITRQLTDYTQRGQDADNWAMLRMARSWPFSLVRFLAEHRHPRAAAGLTSYRFGSAARRFGDAGITNLFATGTMNCHPGWIVADSTYRETMTLSVGYFVDHVDAASMHAFADGLQRLLLGAELDEVGVSGPGRASAQHEPVPGRCEALAVGARSGQNNVIEGREVPDDRE